MFIIGARVVLAILQLLLVRLLTEILTKDDLGSYYLILSTMSIFTMFLVNPFNIIPQELRQKNFC